MQTQSVRRYDIIPVCLVALLAAVVAGGGVPPADEAHCAVLSSGGVVMSDGSAMIVGQAVAGTTSSADYRVHLGVMYCLRTDATVPPACEGNLDGDDAVDAADLAILLGSWGPCPGCDADLNGDDVVDAVDLAQLLGNWGSCP